MENPWALPHIIDGLCTRCGICVRLCPRDALGLDDRQAVIIAPEACDCCGTCEDVCPEDAIDCEFEIVWERDPNQLTESLADGGGDA